MMKKLVLGFTDTYDNAVKFFTWVLGQKYEIERNDEHPDYLIFGDRNFGENNLKYKDCTKIFFTGENQRHWDYDCNYAITFDHINSPKHYRLPLYVLEMKAAEWDNGYSNEFLYTPIADPEKLWEARANPITYIQSNPNCMFRTIFVENLMKGHNVLAAGPHLNNAGFIVPRNRNAKIDLMNKHKLNIAFENGSYPGYVTEKLLDAFYAQTLPIYWGSKFVHRDFNPNRFINFMDWRARGEEEMFNDYITHILNSKDDYIKFLQEPVFINNAENEFANMNNFLDWFDAFVYRGSRL